MKPTNDIIEIKALSEIDTLIEAWKEETVAFIRRLNTWGFSEALSLYHDAWLVLRTKLENGEISTISKAYLFQTCKYLGANQWRHEISNKKQFNQYYIEKQRALQNRLLQNYDIELFALEQETPLYGQQALRVFKLLSVKCQQIIKLKFVEGLTHKGISEQLEHINSEISARTTLSCCLKYWKKLLKKSQDDRRQQ